MATAALVAAAVLAPALGADPDLPAPWLVTAGTAAGLLYALAPLAPSMRRSPAAFERDGHSFRTPPSAGPVIAGVAHLSWLGVAALHPAESGVLLVLLSATLLLYPRALWHGVRLTLTPDGLHDEKFAGTVTIPWRALSAVTTFDPPLDPAAGLDRATTRVRLSFTRPELVTTTGWTVNRRTLEFAGTDVAFVAAAIRHYLAHPEDRQLIGTAEGHARLLPGAGARAS
ncbi:hypothetical protein [Actinoplanes sp. NPDC023714]|uniref:hypothetical protein n=1 Tax=Actinoplanes sp. NPDC023714 TaxID=3154322 RepID=UPI0033CD5D0B